MATASNILRRLEGKVALITGAASGIGESTARLFSRHGAKVVIADIQDDLGHKLCQELDPSSTSFVHCDVTQEADVENAVKKAVSKFGKLDIMNNNAGIGEAHYNIVDCQKSDFERVVGINLVGVFLGTKHAARVMIPNRRGSIINTASASSTMGGSAPHAYTSSKHGVLGLTRNTAVDLGRYGIRVNCVSPYYVPTPLTKIVLDRNDPEVLAKFYKNLDGAVLEPEDVADAALYLASDESKYVSGHNLIVDGGFTVQNKQIDVFVEIPIKETERK